MTLAENPKIDGSENTRASTEESQYLPFNVRNEMFAIDILYIKEILEYGQLTTVPMMPNFIRGVINLRGAVVPVVDLAARFGGDISKVSKRTCIVIIEVSVDGTRQDIGVVVDTVSEVLEIPHTEIEAAPSFGAKIRADFIQGMGKINGKFVIILEVDKVLSIDELSMLNPKSFSATSDS